MLDKRSTTMLMLSLVMTVAVMAAACGDNALSGPPSSTFTGPVGGCGEIFTFRRSEDGTSYLVVSAEKSRLGLSTQAVTFDLATQREGLSVTIDRYERTPQSLRYCNDVFNSNDVQPVRWGVIAGRVTIQLSKDSTTAPDVLYKATVQIQDAVFRSPDGQLVTVASAVIPDVTVGWFPG